jgi:U4/U6.U5 tri-snRNP component SNU23
MHLSHEMAERKAAGAVNFQRRTWDREAASARAAERLEREEGPARGAISGPRLLSDGVGEAAPYRNAEPGMSGPEGSSRAFLTARSVDLHLDAKVNKRKLVTDATPLAAVGGYWCELCQCTLRDSLTWLDHINGIKHQRRMGVSMRVEASTVEDVTAKLARVKQEAAAAAARSHLEADRRDALLEFEGRVAASTEEEKRRKKMKRAQEQKISAPADPRGDGGEGGAGDASGADKSQVVQSTTVGADAAPAATDSLAAGGGANSAEGQEADDFAAMMGFSSFK